jgi:hypothetical protein
LPWNSPVTEAQGANNPIPAVRWQALVDKGQGKFVLPGKRPRNRPIAVHALPDPTAFTTKSTKDTKKSEEILFFFVVFVSFVVNS